VDLPPTEELNIIEAGRTEFASVVLTGEVLKDDTIPAPKSKYYFYETGELA